MNCSFRILLLNSCLDLQTCLLLLGTSFFHGATLSCLIDTPRVEAAVCQTGIISLGFLYNNSMEQEALPIFIRQNFFFSLFFFPFLYCLQIGCVIENESEWKNGNREEQSKSEGLLRF